MSFLSKLMKVMSKGYRTDIVHVNEGGPPDGVIENTIVLRDKDPSDFSILRIQHICRIHFVSNLDASTSNSGSA